MAFTEVWDATVPNDTQAASNLGLYIRNLKTDIQERMTQVMSGPIASRPTTLEAVFGSATQGMLYLATDEGKTYRWDGAAWNLVSCNHVFSDTAQTSLAGDGVTRDANSITIPANYIVAGMRLSVIAYLTIPATDVSTVSFKTGIVTIFGGAVASGSWSVGYDMFCTSAGAGGKYNTNLSLAAGAANPTAVANLAVNTTATLTIKTTYSNPTTAGTARGLLIHASF